MKNQTNRLDRKNCSKRSSLFHFVCSVIFLCALSSDASLAAQSAFKAFFWTQDSDSGSKNGCYGYNQVDSVASSGTRYSSFWLTYTWWHQKFTVSYIPTELRISATKPAAITRSPDHFSSAAWFTGFKRQNSADSIRFYFPLLSLTPNKQSYGRYDYFTVDVDSLCDLEFYGAGDSIMVGTFVHKKPDSRGAVNILARNAIIVELTDANPLRVKTVRCNGAYDSLLNIYLGYKLDDFKKDAAWYGIDIIDTPTTVPKIAVHTVAINGTSPYQAGAGQTVSWKVESSAEVDSFIVYSSFDNKKNWSSAGKTDSGSSSFNWTIPAQTTDSAYIKVTACGKHGERISSTSLLFSIQQKPRFTLNVQSFSDNKVIASWNPAALTVSDAKQFWIAYRAGSKVSSFSETGFDTLHYSLSQTTDTISGLDKTAMYYFTAFVENSSGKFSIANDDAIDSAEARDLTPPVNNLVLSTGTIDSTAISLTWKFDGDRNKDIDSIALWYNKTNTPNIGDLSLSIRLGVWKSDTGSYTLTKLTPDKLYYFALLAKDANGNWADATDKSRLSARTKPVEEGKLSGIADTLKKNDTLSLFDNTLRISSPNIEFPYIDTVDQWDAPTLSGFIVATQGFSFRYGKPPTGTSITITIADNTSNRYYSDSDLSVYKFNTETGKLIYDTATVTRNGSDNSLTFTLSDIRYPFIVMVDTVPPVLTELHPDTTAKAADEPVEGVFTISDNIENPSLQLLSGTGASGYTNLHGDYFSPTSDANTFRYTIPAFAVNGCSGMRSLVIADDGRNRDTINLSHPILRTGNNCDDIVTAAQEWTPLVVTADLENKSITDIMKTALGDNNYSYDNTKQALIRWTQEPGEKGVWEEYRDSVDSAFSVTPGTILWVRSKQRTAFTFDTAVVPALIDTFTLTLKKKVWTDFSLPYNFDIYSGDILAATGNVKSLRLYAWSVDKETQKFSTSPIYLDGIDSLSNKLYTLKGAGAFSAQNNSDKDIVLRIPPTSTVLSTLPAELKKQATGKLKAVSGQWWVKINYRDESEHLVSSMYIAQTPSDGQPQWYSAAPTFSPVSATIINPDDSKGYGHTASGDLSTGGSVYKIELSNSSANNTVMTATLAAANNLLPDTRTYLYRDNDRNTSSPDRTFTTTVLSKQKSTGYLIIGTDAFINKTVAAFNAVFAFTPFASNGALKINYSLPIGVKSFTIAVFDLKGRRVTETTQMSSLQAGKNSLVIPSRFSAGYYIIQMRIRLSDHDAVRTLNKRWMYVR